MTVSSSTNRVSYSGNGTLTVFAYTFKVFDQDDLTVILRASDGTETVQTITTHYTVSGVGDAGGGNVTFVTAPTATETVVILREQPLTQGLDLVPNDPFPAQSLEEALDKVVFMTQKHEEELGRAIKASRTNTITGSEFTISASDRANKVFAFDSSGDVSITSELGVYRGNWAASVAYNQRDIVKDTSNNNIYLANTAHTSSGTTPLSSNADIAKWDLLVDAAAATTSATNAAASETAAQTAQTAAETAQTAAETAQTAAETAETNAETAQTAAETAQTAAETALDSFDDRYLGAKSSDPTLDNDGDALIDGALYFDTTNNVLKFYDLGNTLWKQTTPTSAQQTNIDAAVADAADIGLVAGSITNVNNVGGDITNVNTVAGQISPTNNISTVAGISSAVSTVAGDSAAISALSNLTTEIGLLGVADVITDMGILGTSDVVADMALLATTDVVADMALLGTSANVTAMSNVSGSITNVNTVATNITGVNSFAERYRVEATNPTTDLDAGDLAYVTGDTALKYYNGTNWQSIAPGIGAVSDDATPQLGGNLDVNGNEITSASNGNVVLNPNGTGQIQLNSTAVVKDGAHDFDIASHDGTNGLKLGGVLVTSTAAELNILDGVTATTAELNILDGVTATATELNLLDGVTATTAELNYLDVTTLGTTEASKAVTADANGVITFDNGISEEYTAVTSSSNATTVNLRDGTNFSHTLTENTTFTFSNPASSGKVSSFTLKLVQDASASGYTVTWPTAVDWPSATAPTLTATASAVDYFVFITHDGGTTWYGFTAGQALG